MAFENVDVNRLKNEISTLKLSINYRMEKSIIDDIASSDVWDCAAKDTFKSALGDLINVKYKNLETLLNKYSTLADKIEQYKEMQQKIKAIKNEIRILQSQLYITTTYTDSKGRIRTRRERNRSVANTISSLKSQLYSLQSTSNRLLSEIRSSI